MINAHGTAGHRGTTRRHALAACAGGTALARLLVGIALPVGIGLPVGIAPVATAWADTDSDSLASRICDTSQPVFECRARPELDGDTLLIVSDAPSCSLVEWRLDGEASTTLIVDQGARIGALDDPPRNKRELRRRVTVEQCTEVRDLRVDPVSYAIRRNMRPGESFEWAALAEADRRRIEREGKRAERRWENEVRDSILSRPTHIPEPGDP